jgi:DNA ligase (NAD+)
MTDHLHSEEIEHLITLGFTTNPLNKLFNNIEEAFNYSSTISLERNSLNYPIDGSVIKLNNNYEVNNLGVIGKTNRAWCAFKFEPQEVTTKVVDVTFQVGRTGKITPVAELNDVLIQGTVVRRATLHNIKELINYDLHIQDTVVVRKAGDIIPEIVSILPNLRLFGAKKIIPPKNCPSCSSTLEISDTLVDLVCMNRYECKEQINLRLSYYASKQIANITGLSDKTLKKLSLIFSLKKFSDLYDMNYQTISQLDNFGQKSADKLSVSIAKSSSIDDYRILAGLSIDGIGIENAKLIANIIANIN